jgi:hypothetical protein
VNNEPDKRLDAIGKSEWKDFILGLQEKLNLEQLELLDQAGLKRDFHVSEWISGKRIPINDKKFKFLGLAVKSGFKPKNLVKFGKDVRQSILYNGKWISTKNAKTLEDAKGNALTKDRDIYLNVLRLFPPRKGKNLIKFVDTGKKVILFYDEKRSTRPIPLVLPKALKIDKTFLVGLGIYLGEGSRNRHPKVTNSEPKIINQAIEFFDLFGVERSCLKAWIQLHERSTASFGEVTSYWLRNTYLKPENILYVRNKKSSGNAPVKNFGVVHLEINSILLQLLMAGLINQVELIVKNLSKKKIVPFLKGFFAAEGSVGLAKSGAVNEINFTSTRKDERDMVRLLLNKLDIIAHDYEKRFSVRVFGFNNIRKLVDFRIFEYHPDRDIKLNQGFVKLQSSLKVL